MSRGRKMTTSSSLIYIYIYIFFLKRLEELLVLVTQNTIIAQFVVNVKLTKHVINVLLQNFLSPLRFTLCLHNRFDFYIIFHLPLLTLKVYICQDFPVEMYQILKDSIRVYNIVWITTWTKKSLYTFSFFIFIILLFTFISQHNPVF